MTRSSRGRGRPIGDCGGTAARASASLRRRAGARPTRPSLSSPRGRRRSRRICSCESTASKQAYVDLSVSVLPATATTCRMLSPSAFASFNRSTGAMTEHRKRHFALRTSSIRSGFCCAASGQQDVLVRRLHAGDRRKEVACGFAARAHKNRWQIGQLRGSAAPAGVDARVPKPKLTPTRKYGGPDDVRQPHAHRCHRQQ